MNYTPKQREIMAVIRDHLATTGTVPTLEEIGTHLGIHRVTVHQHVEALVHKGALRKLPQRSRSIEIVDPEFLKPSGFQNLVEHASHNGASIEMREDGAAVVVRCNCGDEIICERK